jgi:hypothetical protein
MPGILGGKRSPAEISCPSHGVVKAVEYPAAGTQRPPPEPDLPPVAGARRTSLPRNRRLRKKILTPVILAVVGIAVGIVARIGRQSDRTVAAVEYPAAGTQRPPPEPDSPPVAGARRTSLPRNRRLRKKILTPVILAVVGIALGIIALVLYPSRTQLPTPTYSTLHLLSHLSAESVTYQVYQVSPVTAEIRISVLLSSDKIPPANPQAELVFFPPLGTTFLHCMKDFCYNEGGGNYEWDGLLIFRRAMGPGALPNTTRIGVNAFVDLFVAAREFGVTSDGATASAAIPKLIYTGPGTVQLVTQYNIPSANDYDWSTFPPAFADGSKAQWLEQMNSNNVTPDVDAAGVNHTAQARDNDLTFIVGALVGLAGGALLAALQAALSATD